MATHVAPRLYLQNPGSELQLAYATNFTGYAVQTTTSLASTNWTTISTGTNNVMIASTNSASFFRLLHP